MIPAFARWSERRRFWGGVLLAGAATCLLRTAYLVLDDVTRGRRDTLPVRTMEEATAAAAGLLLLPLIVWAAGRLRPALVGWPRAVAAHTLVLLSFSLPKTVLMWWSRSRLAGALGFAGYDYGPLAFRLPMELPSDVLTYGVVLTALALVRSVRERRERERQALTLEREVARVRLENVQLQLQPHFLFNALNTISQAIYDDPDAADRMLGHLAELLRRALGAGQRDLEPLREELDLLGHYLALARARFGARLQVVLDVDPTTREALVPPLLLQPLVENAIRHGATPDGTGRIRVAVARQGARLACLVENSLSPATPPESAGSGRRLGLSLTERRLALLYGGEASVESGIRAHEPRDRAPHREATRGEDRAQFQVRIDLPYRVAEGTTPGGASPRAPQQPPAPEPFDEPVGRTPEGSGAPLHEVSDHAHAPR